MRERGQESGQLTVLANTEVTASTSRAAACGACGRLPATSRRTSSSSPAACGARSSLGWRCLDPAHARCPPDDRHRSATHWFAEAKGDIEYPIVRDMDTNMYERQHGSGLEIGSYAHRAILYDPEDLPSVEEASLSPTEFPFTQEDFNVQMEQALELMPSIVGDESVGIKHAINGILSLTPDGMPILGELPEVKGLWSAAAVWIKEGPGVGKSLAEWMVHGESTSTSTPRRGALWEAPEDVGAREGAHRRGLQQDVRDRPPARAVGLEPRRPPSPFHAREQGARRRLLRGRRLGAAAVVRVECAAARGVRRSGRAARGQWDTRWWSPLINAEHLAHARPGGDLRSVGVRDLRPVRARRLDALQTVSMRQVRRRPSGASIYTPWLSPSGGSSPTSRSCGSATSTSASSPAAPTAWPTTSGLPITSRRTARRNSPISPRLVDARPLGARAPATSSPR